MLDTPLTPATCRAEPTVAGEDVSESGLFPWAERVHPKTQLALALVASLRMAGSTYDWQAYRQTGGLRVGGGDTGHPNNRLELSSF